MSGSGLLPIVECGDNRVETRSLSTTANYARLWAGRPAEHAAAALGFAVR
jgi:hypothetical protein